VGIQCVAVATLKRFAADNGAATKLDMARALAAVQPERYRLDVRTGLLARDGKAVDDNEVDAIWLALFIAAVDRGDEQFLSPHQRKAARKAERRAKRLAAQKR